MVFDRDLLRNRGPTSDSSSGRFTLVAVLAARWRGAAVAVKLRLDSLMLLSFVNIAEIVCQS